MKVRNTFIIFMVSGFWHGANWTFIVWGAINAIYFLPLLLTNKNRDNLGIMAQGRYFPTAKESLLMLKTFGLTVFAWIFFRAENIGHAFDYILGIFSGSLFKAPMFLDGERYQLTLILVLVFMLLEWKGREGEYAIAQLGQEWHRPLRWGFYSLILFAIGMFMPSNESPFIYFQF